MVDETPLQPPSLICEERKGWPRKDKEGKAQRSRPKKDGMTEGERVRKIEDKVMVCLCGLDNSPADCNAITADPNLRRCRGRSGPRRRRKINNNQTVRILFHSSSASQLF